MSSAQTILVTGATGYIGAPAGSPASQCWVPRGCIRDLFKNCKAVTGLHMKM